MLTNEQKGLLKQAQAQAQIRDDEYRDTLSTLTGWANCTSSTDPRLTDGHLDRFLAFFEAIYWRGVEQGTHPAPHRPGQIFAQRGYWANKNKGGHTSRDRFTATELQTRTQAAEAALQRHGKNLAYLNAIQAKTGPGWNYCHAIERTLAALRRKETGAALRPGGAGARSQETDQRGARNAERGALPSPCASCPFLETNFQEFNRLAERLCELHHQPKPDFWACTSIRENVKKDAIATGHLLCHSTVYDAQMNATPENGKPCAGLALHFAAQNKSAKGPKIYQLRPPAPDSPRKRS